MQSKNRPKRGRSKGEDRGLQKISRGKRNDPDQSKRRKTQKTREKTMVGRKKKAFGRGGRGTESGEVSKGGGVSEEAGSVPKFVRKTDKKDGRRRHKMRNPPNPGAQNVNTKQESPRSGRNRHQEEKNKGEKER